MAHDLTKDVIGVKEFEVQDINKSGEPANFLGSISSDNHIVNKVYVDTEILTCWLKSLGQTGLTGDKSGSFNLTTTGRVGIGAAAVAPRQFNVLGATGISGTSGSIGGEGNDIRLESGVGGVDEIIWDIGVDIIRGGGGGIIRLKSGQGGNIIAIADFQSVSGSGGTCNFLGGTGGFYTFEASSTINAVAGAGGNFVLEGGIGGGFAGGDTTSGTSTGGAGGSLSLEGGRGNSGIGSTTNNVGGNGGSLDLVGGNGGNSTGSGTAGDGGDVTFDTGTPGTTEDVAGVNGSLFFKVGGTEILKGPSDGSGIEVPLNLTFTGTGKGLVYGTLSVVSNANETTITTQNVYVQVTDFDTNGVNNNTTPDHTNDHITITKAGDYKIECCITANSVAGAGATFEFEIQKNNGSSRIGAAHGDRTLAGGGSEAGAITICTIATLAVNDTVELWTKNETNTQNIIIEDASLSVLQVGG